MNTYELHSSHLRKCYFPVCKDWPHCIRQLICTIELKQSNTGGASVNQSKCLNYNLKSNQSNYSKCKLQPIKIVFSKNLNQPTKGKTAFKSTFYFNVFQNSKKEGQYLLLLYILNGVQFY